MGELSPRLFANQCLIMFSFSQLKNSKEEIRDKNRVFIPKNILKNIRLQHLQFAPVLPSEAVPFFLSGEAGTDATTSRRDRTLEMMGYLREIIPFYGRTIQVSEFFENLPRYLLIIYMA